MSASRLIKLAPTAILLAFLGYASVSLQASLPGAAEKEAALAKGLDVMLKDLAKPESWVTVEPGRLREILSMAVTPPAATPGTHSEPDAAAPPTSDPLADLIAGLSLDATFLQGRGLRSPSSTEGSTTKGRNSTSPTTTSPGRRWSSSS